MWHKNSFDSISFYSLDLPVAAVRYQCRKDSPILQRVSALICSWSMVRIFYCNGTKFPVIPVKWYHTVVFVSEDNWKRPRRLNWLDDVKFEQLRHFILLKFATFGTAWYGIKWIDVSFVDNSSILGWAALFSPRCPFIKCFIIGKRLNIFCTILCTFTWYFLFALLAIVHFGFDVFPLFILLHSCLMSDRTFAMHCIDSHFVGYLLPRLIFQISCCSYQLFTPFRFCRIFALFLL